MLSGYIACGSRRCSSCFTAEHQILCYTYNPSLVQEHKTKGLFVQSCGGVLGRRIDSALVSGNAHPSLTLYTHLLEDVTVWLQDWGGWDTLLEKHQKCSDAAPQKILTISCKLLFVYWFVCLLIKVQIIFLSFLTICYIWVFQHTSGHDLYTPHPSSLDAAMGIRIYNTILEQPHTDNAWGTASLISHCTNNALWVTRSGVWGGGVAYLACHIPPATLPPSSLSTKSPGWGHAKLTFRPRLRESVELTSST